METLRALGLGIKYAQIALMRCDMPHISIHAIAVGGGTLAISQMPGREGDYAGDVIDLAAWKPSIVVTLTTQSELDAHEAGGFGADIRSRAARWVHLPVEDFGVPNKAFEDQWPDVAEMCLRALRGGGRVLLHCKGGCGRSGMAALRLMIEAGEPVEDALGRLRAVRPCAVETDGQYDWAKSGRRRTLRPPGGVR